MRRRTRILLLRRLRNLSLLLLTPPLALLALRTTWSLESSHRLAAIQSTLRAHHLPASPEDLIQPQVPDAENAALPLLDALNDFSLNSLEKVRFSDDHLPPYGSLTFSPEDRTLILDCLQRQTATLQALDLASSRPGVAWPANLTPAFTQGAEDLTTLLLAAIVVASEHDRPDYLRRLLSLARILDTYPENRFFAAYIHACALTFVENNTALTLDDPLILSHLSDDTTIRNATAAVDALFARSPASVPRSFPYLQSWFLSPLASDEAARIQSHARTFHTILSAANWPAAQTLIPKPPYAHTPYLHLDWITIYLSESYDTAGPSRFQSAFEHAANAHALALLLAAANFTAARGRPPQSANDLVPDFLPALPSDPFSPVNAPLQLRPDPTGPTVWSVGLNALDDHAAAILPSPYRSRTSSPDLVYGAAHQLAIK